MIRTVVRRVLYGVLVVAIVCLVAVIALEAILGYRQRLQERKLLGQVEPFYPWSLYTSRGERLTPHAGYLKLAMHPFVGYRNLPRQETPYFTIDGYGFRGPGSMEGTGGNRRGRIMVVGGSTAFGTGLRGDRETFSAQLERLLPGKEVINAAVVGYQSGQELVSVLTRLVDFAPEMVIALNGFNDFGQLVGQEQDFDKLGVNGFGELEEQLRMLYVVTSSGFAGKLFTMPALVFPRTWKACNDFRSRTGELLYKTMVRFGVFRAIKRAGLMKTTAAPDRLSTIARRYAVNMVKMRNLLRGFNADFLCLLQPDAELVGKGEKTAGPLSAENYAAFREQARQALLEEDVAVIDVNDYASSLRPEMFMDRAHLTAEGNRVLAEIAAREILRQASRH